MRWVALGLMARRTNHLKAGSIIGWQSNIPAVLPKADTIRYFSECSMLDSRPMERTANPKESWPIGITAEQARLSRDVGRCIEHWTKQIEAKRF